MIKYDGWVTILQGTTLPSKAQKSMAESIQRGKLQLAILLSYDLRCLINKYEHVLNTFQTILSSWSLVSLCLNLRAVLIAVVAAGFESCSSIWRALLPSGGRPRSMIFFLSKLKYKTKILLISTLLASLFYADCMTCWVVHCPRLSLRIHLLGVLIST